MKPVMIIIDDDPQVLRAVEIDLRQKYGDRFRILKANSGATALDILRQLKLRNEPPALFLVDQRMPHMTGVEFLEQAMEIYPDAKRVLLTAYADTDAAIRSINKAKIDYYLMKPWDPPEENLYPVISDLLEEWMASFRPPFEGIRIIGLRGSPKSHETRNFLARNGIPFQWLDAESDKAPDTASKTVNLLVRGDSLSTTMSQYLVDQISESKNIRVWLHSRVAEIKGENRLEAILIKDTLKGVTQTLSTGGLFIFIGAQPRTDWLSD
jgi:CheY-like chemotaxis protein